VRHAKPRSRLQSIQQRLHEFKVDFQLHWEASVARGYGASTMWHCDMYMVDSGIVLVHTSHHGPR
jgi:hypothetical protein